MKQTPSSARPFGKKRSSRRTGASKAWVVFAVVAALGGLGYAARLAFLRPAAPTAAPETVRASTALAAAAIRGKATDGETAAPASAARNEPDPAQVDEALRARDYPALLRLLAQPTFPKDDEALRARIRGALVAAADGGDAAAMLALGQLEERGLLGKADGTQAARWFERAGDAGQADGYAQAARLFMDGRLLAPDPRKAAALIEKGIAAGSADAHLLKGITLLKPNSDTAAALALLVRAAEMGSGDAALLLSRLHRNGKYLPANEQAALEWAAKAAKLGSREGQVDLGKLLLADGTAPGAVDEGVAQLLDAEARDSGRSALELARLIVNAGKLGPADLSAARAYAEDAFARGLSNGAFAAAMLRVTPGGENAAEVQAWLQAGAKADDWQSKYALLLMKEEGLGPPEAMRRAGASDRLAYTQAWTKAANKLAPKGVTAPIPTHMPAPQFPEGLEVIGAKGTVTAEFMVGTDGVPVNVQILQASDPQLAEAAAAAVARWRYTPGTKNGRPQAMRIRVPIKFSPPKN